MDKDHKEQLLGLAAQRGWARGLRVGADLLSSLIQGRKRIDASELRAALATMLAVADEIDAKTKLAMTALGASGADS